MYFPIMNYLTDKLSKRVKDEKNEYLFPNSVYASLRDLSNVCLTISHSFYAQHVFLCFGFYKYI